MDSLETKMLSKEFISKFKISTVSLQDKVVSYKHGNKPNDGFTPNERMVTFLKCETISFELHLCDEMLRITIENNKLYYLILNLILLENEIDIFNPMLEWKYEKDFIDFLNLRAQELLKLWMSMKEESKAFISDFVTRNNFAFGVIIKEFKDIEKLYYNNELVKKMIEYFENGKSNNSRFFNKNMTVVIYGAGRIGTLLYSILKKRNINVSCFVDEYIKKSFLNDVPIIKCHQLSTYHNYDLIIVTSIYDYDKIFKKITLFTDKKIVSLLEAFNFQ